MIMLKGHIWNGVQEFGICDMFLGVLALGFLDVKYIYEVGLRGNDQN